MLNVGLNHGSVGASDQGVVRIPHRRWRDVVLVHMVVNRLQIAVLLWTSSLEGLILLSQGSKGVGTLTS